MSKHTAIIFLGILVIMVATSGLPPFLRKTLLVLSGVSITVVGYLSSVTYCSNCKKLIDEADQALPIPPENTTTS